LELKSFYFTREEGAPNEWHPLKAMGHARHSLSTPSEDVALLGWVAVACGESPGVVQG